MIPVPTSTVTGISGHSTGIAEERGKGIGTLYITYNIIGHETSVDGTSTTPSKDINQSVQQQTTDSQSTQCEGTHITHVYLDCKVHVIMCGV